MSYDIVAGDVHGRWEYLRYLIKLTKCDRIYQLGDLGYYPRMLLMTPTGYSFRTDDIPTDLCEIHFIDGNHEDHETLSSIINGSKDTIQLKKNLFYHPRGNVFEHNGKNVLCMGGGLSIDRGILTLGYDYFDTEQIRLKTLYELDPNIKIDTVISHTAPTFMLDTICNSFCNKMIVDDFDSSMNILEEIYNMYKPTKWYFGHWHTSFKYQWEQCQFVCLDKIHWGFGTWDDF